MDTKRIYVVIVLLGLGGVAVMSQVSCKSRYGVRYLQEK